jgi:hypothetical protein
MCLQRYESYLLSIRSFSARDHLLKQLMGIKTTYGINQPFKVERLENWRPTWSPSEAHLLSSLVCGYRLLDVMALVHGCNTPAPVVPRTLLQDNEEIFDVSRFLDSVALHLISALGHGTFTQLACIIIEVSKVFHSFGSQSRTKLIKQIRTYTQAYASPFEEPREVCYQFRRGKFHRFCNAYGLFDHSTHY